MTSAQPHPLLAALTEPVLVTDAHGVVTYANPAGISRFGWDKVIGLPLPERIVRWPMFTPERTPVLALDDPEKPKSVAKSRLGAHAFAPPGTKVEPELVPEEPRTDRDLSLAAAMNYAELPVRRRPKVVVLATGDAEGSFPLAERLVGFERSHRMARLALAVRAIKRGQWASGRNHLSLSVRGPIADLTKYSVPGIDKVPFGIHVCHFYRAREDLVDALVPDFAAGLRFNESCVWISPPRLMKRRH